jgi:hypothetical protein
MESMNYQLTSWHRNYLYLTEYLGFFANFTTRSHWTVLGVKWMQYTPYIRCLPSTTTFFKWCFLSDLPAKILYILLYCLSYPFSVSGYPIIFNFITELSKKYANNVLWKKIIKQYVDDFIYKHKEENPKKYNCVSCLPRLWNAISHINNTFKGLTAVYISIKVFWDVIPCRH